jgi:hypothetical protein
MIKTEEHPHRLLSRKLRRSFPPYRSIIKGQIFGSNNLKKSNQISRESTQPTPIDNSSLLRKKVQAYQNPKPTSTLPSISKQSKQMKKLFHTVATPAQST